MDKDQTYLLVFTTFPNAEIARQIGTTLVETQKAACVNLLSPATSIYTWKGGIETDEEIPALLKTTRARFPALEEALRNLHPYDVPEIIAVPIEAGSEAYLEWVRENVGG